MTAAFIEEMINNFDTIAVEVVDELPTEKEKPKTGVLYLKQDKDVNGNFIDTYSESIYTDSNDWVFINKVGIAINPTPVSFTEVPKMRPTNCKNCGAPLPENGKCKYCDSIYQEEDDD